VVARGPRRPVSLAERLSRLRQLEADLSETYPTERVRANHLRQVFAWRVRVNVPVYDEEFDLLIEIQEDRNVRVTAENWTGPMKHTFGANRLCMWFPDDPAERRWQREQGLLVLVDTAVTHLFKELFYRETREWLGEEAPHGPKIESRIETDAA
jgi:hypothetical protein